MLEFGPCYHIVNMLADLSLTDGYTDLMTTMLGIAGLFGPTPPQFNEDALVAGMERHNAEVRAHEQLNDWWSKQPASADRTRPGSVVPA